MKKEKIHLEYLLNATSKNILWDLLVTFLFHKVSNGVCNAFEC